jgi:excisionase family DNA binding protein
LSSRFSSGGTSDSGVGFDERRDHELNIDLPDSLLERLAELIAARVNATASDRSSPWMTARQAADYLGCSVSRIRSLTLTGELPHHRDGRRPLYHRDELDEFIRAGGASCP